MAKTPKKVNKAVTNSIKEALNFASCAFKTDNGQTYQEHVILYGNMLYAFDGVVAAGYPIQDDMQAAPKGGLLSAALAKCKETVSLAYSGDRLTVKSGSFSVFVPCVPLADMPAFGPDANQFLIGQDFLNSLSSAALVVEAGKEEIILSCVRLSNSTVVGTNKHLLIEAWHGLSLGLPTEGVCLPKEAIAAASKASSPIVGIGFSDKSVTFWFENGGWIRSQLLVFNYPDTDKLFNEQPNMQPMPVTFFDALDALKDLSKNDFVWFDRDLLYVGEQDNPIARYQIEGIRGGVCYAAKYLKLIKSVAKQVDFYGKRALTFYGDNVRGTLAQVYVPDKAFDNQKRYEDMTPEEKDQFSKDIPF